VQEVLARHSNGLEQFFAYIKGETGLSILDLAGINQANVSFITSLGHRLYSEDLLRGIPPPAEGADPVASFLEHNLDYQAGQFDGVLIWDVLEYLDLPILAATVERLHRIVKPGSYLLAVFHSAEKAGVQMHCSFRIIDGKTLQLAPANRRRPAQMFNNRSLEKLFQTFDSLKFFLTRDNFREVIVKR
jgi:hypothetical protein